MYVLEGTYVHVHAFQCDERRGQGTLSIVRNMKDDRVTTTVKCKDELLLHWCMLTHETEVSTALLYIAYGPGLEATLVAVIFSISS